MTRANERSEPNYINCCGKESSERIGTGNPACANRSNGVIFDLSYCPSDR